MTRPRHRPQTVLFVDDEPRVLRGLRRLLRDDRWDLRTADSGATALEMVRTHDVDVVVSDLRMPDMDGVRLLGLVRESHPAAVRVMLSGEISDEPLTRSTAVAHQWLTKPCQPEQIVQTLERAMMLRQMLERDELRAMIGRLGDLPIAPRLWTQLQQRLSDPDATAGDVAPIVAGDPGMATKVLRLANSAFMGLSRTVTSIPEAIVYVGLETLRTLVVSMEIFRAFPPDRRVRHFSIDALSSHGEACSALALSQLSDRVVRDQAAAGAVLQDVGQLVHARCDPEGFTALLDESDAQGRSLHEVERDTLGFTHADIGAYLLTLWGLAPPIVDAVRLHHTPLRDGPVQRPTVREAVRIAHLLVHRHRRRARDVTERASDDRLDAELAAAVAPRVLEGWTCAATSPGSHRGAARPGDRAARDDADADAGPRDPVDQVLGS